jgi:hypothetical protein
MQPMERQVRHWLNGRFGMGRRVVKIHYGPAGWRVEAIEGAGDSAVMRSWRAPTEEDALHTADELMSDPRPGERWAEVTDLGRRGVT